MIHPSYTELIDAVNERAGGEEKLVKSRYSIVHAAARRARQLISGAEPFIDNYSEQDKPLSIAVDELYEGCVKILPEEEAAEHYAELEEAAASGKSDDTFEEDFDVPEPEEEPDAEELKAEEPDAAEMPEAAEDSETPEGPDGEDTVLS